MEKPLITQEVRVSEREGGGRLEIKKELGGAQSVRRGCQARHSGGGVRGGSFPSTSRLRRVDSRDEGLNPSRVTQHGTNSVRSLKSAGVVQVEFVR